MQNISFSRTSRAFVALCMLLFFVNSASVLAQASIIVSKVFNGGTATLDTVELLVVRHRLDIRGMMIRDFTPDLNDAASGGYRFTNNSLWASVSAGTVIVLNTANSALQRSTWTIRLGLQNETYFEAATTGTRFDIAQEDMVMIKAAGAPFSGFEGNIHTLGVGISSPRAFTISPAFFSFSNDRITTATPYALATLSTNFIFTGSGVDFVRVTDAANGMLSGFSPIRFGEAHSADHQRLLNQLRMLATSVRSLPPSGISSIFPNPATERVGVQLSQHFSHRFASAEAITLSCYSMLGTLINTQRMTIDKNQTEFWYSCADVAPGAYILEIRLDNGFVERQKFVKIR